MSLNYSILPFTPPTPKIGEKSELEDLCAEALKMWQELYRYSD